MDRDELRVFCDLSGRRTDSEGTVPEELLSPDELLSLTPSRVANGAGSQGLKPNIMFLSRSFRYTITYYENHVMCCENYFQICIFLKRLIILHLMFHSFVK